MTTTIAEQVSARLGDGTTYWTAARPGEPTPDPEWHEGEIDLDALSRAAGATVQREAGRGTRYGFPDGSAIVDSGPAWDLAFPRCWCWRGAGHEEGCPEADRCSAPGCEREVYAHDLCEPHDRRRRRGSSSSAPVRERGTEPLRSLSLRVPASVYDRLGASPGAEARRVLERWAKRQR